MDNTIWKNEIERLLPQYLEGTLSANLKKEVEEWIEESEENCKVVRDLQYILFATDVLHIVKSTDAPRALRQIKRKRKQKKISSYISWFQRIAAILLVPLLATTLYVVFHQDPVSYIVMTTNPGMVSAFTLPDGSKVWLNSQSQIKYPQTFSSSLREVELDGEAYFEVKKNKSKAFIVKTPSSMKVEVLGTEFNIEAYKDNKEIRTTLISGSVKLSYKDENNHEKAALMNSGEEIAYHVATKKIKSNRPYIPTQTAWKEGKVVLRDTPFGDALEILSKRFDVQFIVENDKLYNYSFTGSFDAQHLTLILEHFRLSSGIQYRFVTFETGSSQSTMKQTIVKLY